MAKKTLLSKLNQTVHPGLSVILISLVAIGGITWLLLRFYQYPTPSPSQQNYAQPTPTNTNVVQYSPTPIPTLSHTTYTSDKLGISFSYIPVLPNGIWQYFFTKEIDDK